MTASKEEVEQALEHGFQSDIFLLVFYCRRSRDNSAVTDLTRDPIWQSYERAADAHRRAMRARVSLDEELARRFSEEILRAWDDAHREEERCFEVLSSAGRAVRAKYANV
jgi:hypothetical protein